VDGNYNALAGLRIIGDHSVQLCDKNPLDRDQQFEVLAEIRTKERESPILTAAGKTRSWCRSMRDTSFCVMRSRKVKPDGGGGIGGFVDSWVILTGNARFLFTAFHT